ncbi:Hypothetical predicted protein [Octopus vulgaris]|uniref:Uncharacterized protein n=1 Tax=Octopus vulgaris TaxID=6645 RepID=A0AA36EVW2_OCTVU|nr:Hypothetical predicted protein [Octopus vulgaris]
MYHVSKVQNLNLLRQDAITKLKISIDNLLFSRESNMEVKVLSSHLREVDAHLQESCSKLCNEYVELFKPELGCLQGFELDMQFKSNAKPLFCKPESVPFTLQADLTQAINAGIKKGIWTPVPFNEWGTPVVPVRKKQTSQTTGTPLRICGDYSVTVNSQLEIHQHPLPLPEELM